MIILLKVPSSTKSLYKFLITYNAYFVVFLKYTTYPPFFPYVFILPSLKYSYVYFDLLPLNDDVCSLAYVSLSKEND